MKVGYIVQTNQKGQIVIPAQVRKKLGITKNTALNLIQTGEGIYLQPIEEVIGRAEKEGSYLELLKLTRGAWSREGWSDLRKKRRKIEIAASQKRKKQW